MNGTSSTLVAHCGARKVTREELKEIPVPEGTDTHQPLSHYGIVEVLEEALSFRYLKVTRDEYAISADGMKMFGIMDLNTGFDGGSFSIGLRNSNDKSMRLALTAGYRVFVCDNMAFSGDFTPLLQKHSRSLALGDSISIAVDRIQRGFASLESRFEDMRQHVLTDNDARILIYTVFLERTIRGVRSNLMPVVHDHYFNPKEEAFTPRNLWSLSNAFTSSFKTLAPMKQFGVTAKLGAFFKEVQETSGQSRETKLLSPGKEILNASQSEGQLGLSESIHDGNLPTEKTRPDGIISYVNSGRIEEFDSQDQERLNKNDRFGETYEGYEEYLDGLPESNDDDFVDKMEEEYELKKTAA